MRRPGSESMTLNTDKDVPLGANFVICPCEFEEARFDPAPGRTGIDLTGGDDVMLLRNKIGRGYFGVWVADARVQHYIPPEQMTQDFLSMHNRAGGKDRARNGRWARKFNATAITKGHLDDIFAGA